MTTEENIKQSLKGTGLTCCNGYVRRQGANRILLRVAIDNIQDSIPFGKHKGCKWVSVINSDPQYIFWGLRSGAFSLDYELLLFASNADARLNHANEPNQGRMDYENYLPR